MRVYTNSVLELDGGRWQLDPRTRVQVWVPDRPVVVECAFDDPEPEPEPVAVKKPVIDNRIRRVPCPGCDGTKSKDAKVCDPCARTAKRNKPIEHGTAAGYRRHLRHKTAPCDDCIEANYQYGLARRVGANQLELKETA